MRYKILLLLILTVLITGMNVYPAVAATSIQEVNTEATTQYNNTKTVYQKTVDAYKSARQDWISARDKYLNNKSQENAETAIEEGRGYITKACSAMVGYLNMIKIKVEAMSVIDDDSKEAIGIEKELKETIINEINTDIDWLTNKQIEVENMDTKDELVAVAKDIDNHWDDIKAKVKRYTGEILASRIEYVVGQLQDIQVKVDEKIELLEAEGQDVSQLNRWSDSYQTYLTIAEEKYKQARTQYRKITSLSGADELFQAGHEFLKEADQAIRSAYGELDNIVTELKKRKIGEKELSGTGILYVQGSGEAELSGKGTVKGETDTDSTMTVTDNIGNAYVETYGQGTKEAVSENTTLYKGFGKARVTGSDIEVNIESGSLDLEAFGTGEVYLKGSGTYKVGQDGPEKEISPTGTTIEIKSVGAAVASP